MEIFENTIIHDGQQFSIGDLIEVKRKFFPKESYSVKKMVYSGKLIKIKHNGILIDNSQKYEGSIEFVNFDEIHSISKIEDENNLIKINHKYYDGVREFNSMNYIKNSNEINIDINMKDMKVAIDDLLFVYPKLQDNDLLSLRENNNKSNYENKKYKIQEAKIVLFQDGKELTVEYPQDLRIAKENYMYTIEFYSMDNNINIKEYLKVSKLEVHKYGKYEDDSECEIVDTYSGFESLKIIESLEFNGLKTLYKLVYNRSKSKELTDEATLKKIKDNDTFGLSYKQRMDELLKWANSSTDAESKKQAQETYKTF